MQLSPLHHSSHGASALSPWCSWRRASGATLSWGWGVRRPHAPDSMAKYPSFTGPWSSVTMRLVACPCESKVLACDNALSLNVGQLASHIFLSRLWRRRAQRSRPPSPMQRFAAARFLILCFTGLSQSASLFPGGCLARRTKAPPCQQGLRPAEALPVGARVKLRTHGVQTMTSYV